MMKLRVLLAEHEPDIQLGARLALRRAGFDVSIAASGVEVLANVTVETPDVILLDWMIPTMDGPDACAWLKANPKTRDIPMIFLTSKAHEPEIQRGVVGARGYITKPIDALTFGERVKELLPDFRRSFARMKTAAA